MPFLSPNQSIEGQFHSTTTIIIIITINAKIIVTLLQKLLK